MNPFYSMGGHTGWWAVAAAQKAAAAGTWGGRGWRAASGALRAGTSYLGALGAGNPTAWGATVGAGYGMASDDTSIIGGGLMGAGLGRYGGAAALGAYNAPAFRAGVLSFGAFSPGIAGRAAWGAFKNQGKADWRAAWTNGVASKGFIGRTKNRAVNGWRALWR